MAYQHIENLYKMQDVLLFRECYALEKIHGTSAHIGWHGGLKFSSGGEKHKNFVALFDAEQLDAKFTELGQEKVVVYGEAYGGKCQGMRETYGDQLRFVAFEVKIGDSWLSVPQAEDVARSLGFDFVHYARIPTDLSAIDAERDADSVQAVKNGMGEGKMREGIVLRPVIEVTKNNGSRIIAKHKRPEFSETKAPRELDPDRLKVLSDASAVAEEWVTDMRLTHVLDKIENPCMEKMRDIISAMFEDVKREGEGEIEWSQEVHKAIGTRTAQLTKQRLMVVKDAAR